MPAPRNDNVENRRGFALSHSLPRPAASRYKCLMPSQTVAVFGASNNPERYSHMAVVLLKEHHHTVIPIHPALESIAGLPVVKSLREAPPVDTLTLYVGAAKLPAMTDEIVRLRPRRVIFNPGTESSEVQAALDTAGIPWLEACTLVMLRTGQF